MSPSASFRRPCHRPNTSPILRRSLAAFVGAFAATSIACAESATPLRLGEMLAAAERDNPALHAARERATAAAAVPARVASWDDPTFSYEAWNVKDDDPVRVDHADNDILRLTQRVPFPGKRTLAGEAAAHDADAARHDVDGVALDVRAAVKRAFADLWEAHQLAGVYARERDVVERLARVTRDRYGLGDVSQADAIRAQVELTHVLTRAETQGLRVERARAALNVLLSRSPDAPLGVPEDPPPVRLDETPAALVERALRTRPELASQTAMVARETTGVALARRSYLPDFEFSVGRFVNPGTRDGYGAMAAVSIPIVHRAKYDAGVSEARARETSARADLRRLEDRIRGEVEEAYLRAREALVERTLLVETHIPQAEHSLRVSEAGYQAGRDRKSVV